MTTDISVSHPALTTLSEEESAFRDAVAAFADQEVRPRVQEMERAARIDPALIPALFELGLMGIEVPDAYGGAAGSLMMVTLAVEERSAASMPRRRSWSTCRTRS
jgi:alkylation response protein AidB-like acyl-CoA dehydrogenase